MATKVIINRKELRQTAYAAGVLGSFGILVLRAVAQVFGLTEMNIGFILGSWFTGKLDGLIYIGFPIQIFLFSVFSLAYVPVFRRSVRAGAGLGALIGIAQWVILGLFLGWIGHVHPMMPRTILDPGFFAVNYGTFEFLFFCALNVGYGALVGYFCEPIVRRAILRAEMNEEIMENRVA